MLLARAALVLLTQVALALLLCCLLLAARLAAWVPCRAACVRRRFALRVPLWLVLSSSAFAASPVCGRARACLRGAK